MVCAADLAEIRETSSSETLETSELGEFVIFARR